MSETLTKMVDGVVVPLTVEENAQLQTERSEWEEGADARAAQEVRIKRNALLANTDWYGMSDVTMPSEIASYRQALRDIPSQEGFPNTITWPTEPEN